MVYFALNYWGVKLFVKTNTAITVFKLVVPALTAVALISSRFNTDNFGDGSLSSFAPYGWSAVFTAVAASDIVFSYNGFQSPVSLAGEARNPGRSIPFALIGSVVIALVIYVLLQIAFIGAVSPESIADGWHRLNFDSPLAQLALALNLNWLAMLLYLDAFVSPSGTGSIYTATTARMIYAMEKNNTLPRIFGQLHPLYGVPRQAMWLNLAVSFVFLFFFRGWGILAAVISCTEFITDGIRNAILTHVTIMGDTRSYSPEVQRLLETRMCEISEGICHLHGARCEFEYTHEFAPTVNWADNTALAVGRVVGEQAVDAQVSPMMISEDFGAFIQQVPGNFVFIGNGAQGEEGATPLHNAAYDFNDAILATGARYFAEVVRLSLPA